MAASAVKEFPVSREQLHRGSKSFACPPPHDKRATNAAIVPNHPGEARGASFFPVILLVTDRSPSPESAEGRAPTRASPIHTLSGFEAV